jgi:N6-adenosine-specific RNA methylase IME4
MNIKISEELKKYLIPLKEEEYLQLEENIKSDGCRDPLVLWGELLIDGHNRYEICTKHGITFKTETLQFADELDVKEWMIKNQFGKRNLTAYERADLALKYKPIYAERAKKLQGYRSDILPTLVKSDPVNTQKELSKKAGVSHGTLAKVETIQKEASPEIIKQVKDGEITINKAYQNIKSEKKKNDRKTDIEKQVQDIEKSPLPVLDKKYHVISIDPPWPYESKEVTTYDPNGRRASNPYPEMSIKQIADLQMPVADDSVIWLWTTHKFLPDSFSLLKEWGFEYKATMVWDKQKIGLGHWLRMQCEFCLLGIKGNPVWENTTVRDVLSSARREHSRKPDEFFHMVEKICSGAKLEYFSREKRPGWDQFGNDTEKF